MNYAQARRAYLEWYSHLLSPPEVGEAEVNRSQGGTIGAATVELVEQRIEGLALASEELTAATRTYLKAPDHNQRTAAVDSLLHQIDGDLSVANMLWSVIEEAEDADATAETLVRSSRGTDIRHAYRRLASEMPASIEDALGYGETITKRSAGTRPETLPEALADLRFEIDDTIELVTDRALSVGLRLTRDLFTLGSAQWAIALKAIDLLQGQEKVGNIGWGLEDEVASAAAGLAGSLRSVLVNIVEKILVVIEKNDLVRYTITDWLTELKEIEAGERKPRLGSLLEQLYQTREFRERDLDIWLSDATDVTRIHHAADEIMHLGDNFDRLANQTRRLGTTLSIGSIFLNPVLMSVGLALQVGLLSMIVFAGYDHLDEGARALNITRGLKEVLIETLPVSRQTLTKAEAIKAAAIREGRRSRRAG